MEADIVYNIIADSGVSICPEENCGSYMQLKRAKQIDFGCDAYK